MDKINITTIIVILIALALIVLMAAIIVLQLAPTTGIAHLITYLFPKIAS